VPALLRVIKEHAKPNHRIFVGVVDPINPRVETPEEVRNRVLEAAEYLPRVRLGTTDDCRFSPFGDDTSMARETAFEKIQLPVRRWPPRCLASDLGALEQEESVPGQER
jgi:5-methyltetrahydropteroyltriglutamate--homocysteine methyltransferase